jgi:UDP-N-acetylglucosamine--N-acetylmuramyl-(pentapeptide) pyrophosphoryl-undecaprenol N-acetylglucosamine transferase
MTNQAPSSNQTCTIMIAAGGTGGHVYPGLAVARALEAQGIKVVWIGTRKGLEARVIPEAGIEMAWLNVSGLRGKGVKTLLLAPFKLVRALFEATQLVLKHKPAAVLGMGGFVAGPGCLMAAILGKPGLIHEQNAVAGLTNKLLAKVAKQVLEAFPNTFAAHKKVLAVGNPVRQAITAVPTPSERFQARHERLNILVVGGSLGALALNENVPKALALLDENLRPNVLHQSGAKTLEVAQQMYAEQSVQAEVVSYIEDMASAYAAADLVICRAGAMTISELAAVGVGSILVPYPYAVDDHQTANAAYLADQNAAILMPQPSLTPEHLAETLRPLLQDRTQLLAMAEQARALAKPHATDDVVDKCKQFAKCATQV